MTGMQLTKFIATTKLAKEQEERKEKKSVYELRAIVPHAKGCKDVTTSDRQSFEIIFDTMIIVYTLNRCNGWRCNRLGHTYRAYTWESSSLTAVVTAGVSTTTYNIQTFRLLLQSPIGLVRSLGTLCSPQ